MNQTEKRRHRKTATPVSLPSELDTVEFRKAWSDWQADRKERGKPLTTRAQTMQLRKLAAMGPAEAVACIESSISNSWIGLFPKDRRQPKAPPENPMDLEYSRKMQTQERAHDGHGNDPA